MLKLCLGCCTILDPDAGLPPWAIEVFTDSAGGSRGGMRALVRSVLTGGLFSTGLKRSTMVPALSLAGLWAA